MACFSFLKIGVLEGYAFRSLISTVQKKEKKLEGKEVKVDKEKKSV